MSGTIVLVGCGILKKEVRFLIAKNHWRLETHFLDSALHIDFDQLAQALRSALLSHREDSTVVFYGTCHPLMDRMLAAAGTFRTRGQNCVEMLLGHELFAAELERGAYFLLEDWAMRWEPLLARTFNTTNLELIREIFGGDRSYLLALKTPCSGDFREEAEAAGRTVGLPVRFMEVTLDRLEAVLREALEKKEGEAR